MKVVTLLDYVAYRLDSDYLTKLFSYSPAR